MCRGGRTRFRLRARSAGGRRWVFARAPLVRVGRPPSPGSADAGASRRALPPLPAGGYLASVPPHRRLSRVRATPAQIACASSGSLGICRPHALYVASRVPLLFCHGVGRRPGHSPGAGPVRRNSAPAADDPRRRGNPDLGHGRTDGHVADPSRRGGRPQRWRPGDVGRDRRRRASGRVARGGARLLRPAGGDRAGLRGRRGRASARRGRGRLRAPPRRGDGRRRAAA